MEAYWRVWLTDRVCKIDACLKRFGKNTAKANFERKSLPKFYSLLLRQTQTDGRTEVFAT